MKKIKCFEDELADLESCEELWWSQSACALWLKEWDKTTKFFLQKASQCKSRNEISSIQNQQGRIFNEEEDNGQVFNSFFADMFTSSNPSDVGNITIVLKDRLTPMLADQLGGQLTNEEIFSTIKQIKPLAAPGPDGMPALFYQKY